jgi:hypothetical protein
MDWIKACIRWAVEEELVDARMYHGLQVVRGLRRGSGAARDPEPARPGEICAMTPAMLDTSGAVWICSMQEHKTAHHGRDRRILLGPRAQEIVRPYLRPTLDQPLFSPADSERRRHPARRVHRPECRGRRRPGIHDHRGRRHGADLRNQRRVFF